MRTPLVEAEQNGAIRIQNLTKIVMARRRPGLAEERLVPLEAAGNVAYADDRPCAFHRIPLSYLSPRGLPAVRRRIASFRRLTFVSSRLAVSIQPMYRRRCEGASLSKERHAAGCFLNAAWM